MTRLPSRLNGENVAGAAFLLLSLLFMTAGTLNAVFALIFPVSYLLAAIGAALVLLGYRTWKIESGKATRNNTAVRTAATR